MMMKTVCVLFLYLHAIGTIVECTRNFGVWLGYNLRNQWIKVPSLSDVIQPRHCHVFSDCSANESCYVEQYISAGGEHVYRTGCKANSVCNEELIENSTDIYVNQDKRRFLIKHGPPTCSECCSGDLCNSAGCGEQGYPLSRGPACYDCYQTRNVSMCNEFSICNPKERCYIEEQSEFGDKLFKTGCLSEDTCALSNAVPNEIGKRDGHKRNTLTCNSCCTSDFCNNKCPHCKADYTNVKALGLCYKIYHIGYDHAHASNQCKADGASLLQLNSNSIFQYFVKEFKTPKWISSDPGNPNWGFWINGKYKYGLWVDENGKEIKRHIFWDQQAPATPYNDTCISFAYTTNGPWFFNRICSKSYYFICHITK